MSCVSTPRLAQANCGHLSVPLTSVFFTFFFASFVSYNCLFIHGCFDISLLLLCVLSSVADRFHIIPTHARTFLTLLMNPSRGLWLNSCLQERVVRAVFRHSPSWPMGREGPQPREQCFARAVTGRSGQDT